MGATRKLQGEIDKVLKKVQEGVDVFDSIWNKVYDTENANQKEKFEADLKKEIKKLQRYRDQIKTWLQSSEIKDKKALLDARKLIEKEMERFKVCEKETKTKAFSKEGLGQQPKTDPREKAKSESRDWLNTMVSDLENQVEYFEAEVEGLTVKKSKTRPPRLTHLEESINRHKQHIVKLEQILRLLDNDGVSPDHVNDVKDLVEDYVERNQDDFDDFSEVDEIYSAIPLEKIEALENMETIANVASVLLVKDKGLDDSSSQQTGIESGARSPPLQIQPDPPVINSSTAPGINSSVSMINGINGVGIGSPTMLSIRVPKINNQSVPSSPVASAVNEEEGGSYLGRPASFSRGTGRGTLPISVNPGQSSPLVSIGMPISAAATSASGHGIGSSIQDLTKRSALASDERLTTAGGLSQQLNPSGAQSRVFMQPTSKLADIEAGSSSEGGIIGGNRMFSSPGGQWRSSSAIQFSSPEAGQYVGRTEIAPDQKQKFLQRLQQVSQQHQHSNPLLASSQQISHIAATNPKQVQLQLLQNQPVSLLQNAVLQQQQQQQSGLTLGGQGQVAPTPTTQPQTGLQQGLQAQQITNISTAQQIALPSGVSVKENDPVSARIGELSVSNLQHKLLDEVKSDNATLNTPYTRPGFKCDDDLKNADTFDVPVGGPGTLAELSRWSNNVEPTGQNVQPAQTSSSGPGVIGRRSVADLGAIGDNLITTTPNDQLYNLQMLEAASHKMPLPQDSEQSRSYTPRHPAVTPSSYPQTPAELIDNPAFWERLDTDGLFFAFYYQQSTYQQYLAARELKKQSWRYHKKYNTWFQRHEEPKVTTDEFEQGTYVYFDFHILHDDYGQGWCQRIKTEFTFEYSYLEDELVV